MTELNRKVSGAELFLMRRCHFETSLYSGCSGSYCLRRMRSTWLALEHIWSPALNSPLWAVCIRWFIKQKHTHSEVSQSICHVNICLVFVYVHKLVEVRGRPRMKISEDPEKSTVPGRKAVYRLLDTDGENRLVLPVSTPSFLFFFLFSCTLLQSLCPPVLIKL